MFDDVWPTVYVGRDALSEASGWVDADMTLFMISKLARLGNGRVSHACGVAVVFGGSEIQNFMAVNLAGRFGETSQPIHSCDSW